MCAKEITNASAIPNSEDDAETSVDAVEALCMSANKC